MVLARAKGCQKICSYLGIPDKRIFWANCYIETVSTVPTGEQDENSDNVEEEEDTNLSKVIPHK